MCCEKITVHFNRPLSSVLSGTYFNCIMFMVASSVVTTIMVLNYHHRHKETHAMPAWVQTVFLQYLPWLLMMSRPGKRITRKTIMMQRKLKELDRSVYVMWIEEH